MENILIISASVDTLGFVVDQLMKAGIRKECIRTADLASVSDLSDKNRPELILLHICHTGEKYFSLARSINAIYGDVPVIVISDTFSRLEAQKLKRDGIKECLLLQDITPALLLQSVTYAMESTQMVAELEAARSELYAAYSRYNKMFARNPIPMWIYDTDTLAFLEVNQAAIERYGYSRDEFMKMTLKDIRPEEDMEHFYRALALQEEGEELHEYYRHKTKQGEILYVSVQTHMTTVDGKLAKMVQAIDVSDKVFLDTENTKLEALVQRQRDNLDEILSSIEEVVWSAKTDDLQILYTNNACYKVFGYTADEMINDRHLFLNSIHPDDREMFYEIVNKTYSEGKGRCEFRIIHKEGDIKTIAVQGVLKKGKNGKPDVFNGVTIDITEQKNNIRKIKLQNEKLKEIAWLQSHKVRGQVASILGLAQLFNTDNPCDPVNSQILDGFRMASESLDNTIREINEKTSSDTTYFG